jgi:hypothetical protein
VSVVLVGNGPSITERPLGAVIDSFNTVVRFNSFKTKGYEEFCGRKKDVLFAWSTSGEDVKFNKMVFVMRIGTVRIDGQIQKLKEACEKENVPHMDFPNNVIIDTYGRMGFFNGKKPRTGAVVLNYYLNWLKIPVVHIVGFDGGAKDGKYHYYPGNWPLTPRHDPALEMVWIKNMKKKGRIINL